MQQWFRELRLKCALGRASEEAKQLIRVSSVVVLTLWLTAGAGAQESPAGDNVDLGVVSDAGVPEVDAVPATEAPGEADATVPDAADAGSAATPVTPPASLDVAPGVPPAPAAALPAPAELAAVNAEVSLPAAPALVPEAEINVTVVGTPVARTPGSAHILKSEQLQRFEYDDAHAVLASVPGVYTRGEDGMGLRPNIGIRGVNPDRSKKITLMEDGVLLGPAPYSAPAAYYFPLITRMTQVRVIKGPAAIGNGPQTIGGAIDFITRPIPTTTSGGVDVAFGQYGYRKAHVHVGSSYDKIGFLIEGVHLGSNGFKELPSNADTGFVRNEWMFKGSYLISPTSRMRNELRLKATYSDERSNETYLGLSDADFRDDPLQRYGASALDQMKNHRTSVVLTHIFEPSDQVRLTTNVYRHDYARSWRKVNSFRGASLFNVLTHEDDPRSQEYLAVLRGQTAGTGLQALMIGPNEREYVSQGVDTRLRWDATTGPIAHRMEYGLRFHHDSINRRHSQLGYNYESGVLAYDGTPVEVAAFNQGSTSAFAAHATDAISWKRITFTPGLRYEAIYLKEDDFIADTDKDRWVNVLAPGAGLYVGFTESFGALAGVYRGFSPPPPGSGRKIKPELSINYEGGFRFTKGAARAEVIGFYNDYQNFTNVCTFSSGCNDANVDKQFDAGKARIYGLEAFLDYAVPVASFKIPLLAAYTLTRAEFLNTFSSDDHIFGMVTRGDEMPYVPRHQVTASTGVEHRRGGGNVSLMYVAAMREMPGTRPLSRTLATDDQVIVDLSGRYRLIGPLFIYANLRNAFDSMYIVSRRPFGARPNAPRWIQVGLKADF